jgi:hypothetical protein
MKSAAGFFLRAALRYDSLRSRLAAGPNELRI